MSIDMAAESDLDRVAQIAFEITEKLREEDLAVLNRELVHLCRFHPVKSAQIITALAAWFDPETSTTTLWDRVESITATRVLRRCAHEPRDSSLLPQGQMPMRTLPRSQGERQGRIRAAPKGP